MHINLTEELKDDKYIDEVISDLISKNKPVPNNFPLTLIKTNPSTYDWSPPRLVRIPKSDGKSLRDIYIFNEQDSLLQKIINKILFTNLGNLISGNVYSYTKGLRTSNAVSYVKQGLQSKSLIGYKLDIKNYFLSVSPQVISKAIDELIEDASGKKLLNKLFSINSYVEDGVVKEKFLSLMPGSAVSAFFANYVLTPIDKILSTFSEVYARYSDDLVFFCKSQKELDNLLTLVSNVLNQLGLTIHPNKIELISNSENLEFLGLKIIGDEITISDSTYQNIKNVVRQVCKYYRTKFDKSRSDNKSPFYYVKQAVVSINRKLYKSILDQDSEHKSSRLSYVFANITSDCILKDFDEFICKSLNYVFTGKHNRSPYRLSISQLEDLGFYSSVKLFNLYKLDRDLYINEVYLLNRTRVKKFPYVRKNFIKFESPVEFRKTISFYELFSKVLETPNSTFFFNGVNVPAEYITFDLTTDGVYVQGYTIIENGELLVPKLEFSLSGKCYYVITKDMNLIESSTDCFSESKLFDLFVSSAYTTDLSLDSVKPHSGFTRFILFRFYSINELLTNFDEKILCVNDSFEKRQVRFLSYLFLNLTVNNVCKDFNYSHNLIKIGKNEINLVLNKNVIYKLRDVN